MKRRFSHYRWVTLISFAVMYNFVYLGRFNVNNNMERFVADVGMNDVQTYIPKLRCRKCFQWISGRSSWCETNRCLWWPWNNSDECVYLNGTCVGALTRNMDH